MEGRPITDYILDKRRSFIHPSGWRATNGGDAYFSEMTFIHALRVEGDDAPLVIRYIRNQISIHALRVEGRPLWWYNNNLRIIISIPRPPGGGRLKLFVVFVSYSLFLSTPSGWRATCFVAKQFAVGFKISIHALRVEGDSLVSFHFPATVKVYPRLRVEGDYL